MKKFLIPMMAVFALALVVAPASAKSENAKGPHMKATGGVHWTARGGDLPGLKTEFQAHDLGPGMDDKGMIKTYRSDFGGFNPGTITIDVKCVNVEGDQAWMGGVATDRTGGYAEGTTYDYYVYWVKDVSSPGSEGDLIGGNHYNSLNQACNVVKNGSFIGSGVVDSGNLVVHN